MHTETEQVKQIQPFLTCANSKWALLSDLLKRVPKTYNRYHEPFFGSGALFFRLQPDDARVADIRVELVHCLRTIRDNPTEVWDKLAGFKNKESFYYKIRAQALGKMHPVVRAATHIYTNRVSLAGWDYENASGKFDVPYGHIANVDYGSVDNLKRVSESLSKPGVQVVWGSFELLTEVVEHGDFVYLDPPHLPGKAPSINSHTMDGFGFNEYKKLAEVYKTLTERGAHVMVTCTHLPEITSLFGGARIEVVPVGLCQVNLQGTKDSYESDELIVRNY